MTYFKYYNDTNGHNAGDELIVMIAHGLWDGLRETDVIARLGGDEFIVLLPQEDHDSADEVAASLLERVRELAPATARGQLKRVTASIGIACCKTGDRLTADELMVNADLAMYDAKDGRDRIAHYRTDPRTRPRMESEMKWAREISEALTHDRFELLAQTIEPLSARGHTQYELLLRMRDVHDDLIQPESFLYIAERLGLIQDIDRWVTDRLSELGCKFALDDFGAGFGSFYYLKHLPFDYLKIDGEFVRNCAQIETDRTLISAVVQIARGMGKLTIAEFVENQETVDILTHLGVDYAQGYYLSRPEPLENHLLGRRILEAHLS